MSEAFDAFWYRKSTNRHDKRRRKLKERNKKKASEQCWIQPTNEDLRFEKCAMKYCWVLRMCICTIHLDEAVSVNHCWHRMMIAVLLIMLLWLRTINGRNLCMTRLSNTHIYITWDFGLHMMLWFNRFIQSVSQSAVFTLPCFHFTCKCKSEKERAISACSFCQYQAYSHCLLTWVSQILTEIRKNNKSVHIDDG